MDIIAPRVQGIIYEQWMAIVQQQRQRCRLVAPNKMWPWLTCQTAVPQHELAVLVLMGCSLPVTCPSLAWHWLGRVYFPFIAHCSMALPVHTQESHENKLIYTQLFHQYTELVEAGIESRLKKAVDGFDMQVGRSMHCEAIQQACTSQVVDRQGGDMQVGTELWHAG
jgi:hypothetical protein